MTPVSPLPTTGTNLLMTRFTTTVRTDDILDVDAAAVWAVMTDPGLLADLTPAVAEITPLDGDLWCWRMVGIDAMGISVAPSFTERMAFDHDRRTITFEHAPPDGKTEAAGARGTYVLLDTDAGAYVGIDLTAHVDLPLPRMAGPAVRKVMDKTIVAGGGRFADKLMAHLGVTRSRGLQVVPADSRWPRAESSPAAG